ncbi:ATPase AAA [Bifidobacterium myosotis]|uniref:ATPase AAA n=1 Tax=Bifidobacterium myosotis TaxID=1630166 RepID=A0A261FQY8_9BIFI|nr:ATPase AAA [Bifidobacterium myosotis]
MASFDGPISATQVAAHMHKIPKYAATYRKRLRVAYVIRETERGEIDFTVPFLREHL